MHVAGLCIFEQPSTAHDDFVGQLVKQIYDGKFTPSFPFNQVLRRFGFWDTDDNFDLSHHFHHVALPTDASGRGSMTALMAYISREHGRMLDRSRPLWEFHLIEGLAPEKDGAPPRFAIYVKIHHAMADGIAAMRLLQLSLCESPDERTLLPFWSLTTKNRNQIDALLPIHKPAWHIIKEQLGTIKPVCSEIWRSLLKRSDTSVLSTFDTPKSMLNQRIGSARQLAMQSFDKSRFVRIAEHFGTTTNDVILAVCAGALREYLLSQNALPDKPLSAFVPVSLRKDKSALGNQISFLLTNLGTHLDSPMARLATIKSSIDDGKRRFARMNQAQIINYSALIYGWAGLNLITRAHPTRQAFNLIISNVPAMDRPLYLNGARLTGIFPASVLFDGQALNITLTNFQNTIDVGITACSDALPNSERLLEFMQNELDRLTALLK